MDQEIIRRFETERSPRYTSYPTAVQFAGLAPETAASWLRALAPGAELSVYLHVPYCRELCWYCGCNTRATQSREPVEAYVRALLAEIDLVEPMLGRGRSVRHLHWGGGTPTIIGPTAFRRIMARLRQLFSLEPDGEIAVEIDPRTLDAEMVGALAASGVNRVSLGLQTTDVTVQQAVNRVQPFDKVAWAAGALKAAGIARLNIDLMTGLPHQTVTNVEATVEAALSLNPDRLAVFAYAHVPGMKSHQRLLNEAELPGTMERVAQIQAVHRMLVAAGYDAIGLDHFARADDPLAIAHRTGKMRRNFQGYTDDQADALIPFGASAIGSLPQGYLQNAAKVPDYLNAIAAGRLATARGIALSADDRLRRMIIERIMCDGTADIPDLARQAGLPAPRPSAKLDDLIKQGVAVWDGRRISVTEACRPLVRSVASLFDAYLDPQAARHAATL